MARRIKDDYRMVISAVRSGNKDAAAIAKRLNLEPRRVEELMRRAARPTKRKRQQPAPAPRETKPLEEQVDDGQL